MLIIQLHTLYKTSIWHIIIQFLIGIIDTYLCLQNISCKVYILLKYIWKIKNCLSRIIQFLNLYFLTFLNPILSSASPQVRLHPHDLLLLLPDDGAQSGQQWGLITPGVRSHAVIETRQLVQQRLLVLWTCQQLLLRLAVALQLWPRNVNDMNHSFSQCLHVSSLFYSPSALL